MEFVHLIANILTVKALINQLFMYNLKNCLSFCVNNLLRAGVMFRMANIWFRKKSFLIAWKLWRQNIINKILSLCDIMGSSYWSRRCTNKTLMCYIYNPVWIPSYSVAHIIKAPRGSESVDTDGWKDQSCPHNPKHKVMIHDPLLCRCSCRQCFSCWTVMHHWPLLEKVVSPTTALMEEMPNNNWV